MKVTRLLYFFLFLVLLFAIFLSFKKSYRRFGAKDKENIKKKIKSYHQVPFAFFFWCSTTFPLLFDQFCFIAIYVCVNQSPLISTLITSLAPTRVFIWIRIGSDCKLHCFLTRPCHTKKLTLSQLRLAKDQQTSRPFSNTI